MKPRKLLISTLLAAATALPMSSANAFWGGWMPWDWFDGPGWGGYYPYYGYPYYGYPYGGYPYWGGYPYGGYPYYGGYPGWGGWGPWY